MNLLKKSLIAPTLAVLLYSNLYAKESYTVESMSLKEAIENISKKANIPYMVNSNLIKGKTSQKIENISGVKNALDKVLENSGLEATILDGTIIIKKKKLKEKNTILNNNIHKFDDIMVTGELQEKNLQDTHSSVSVILGEELDTSMDQDLSDVLEKVAGINGVGSDLNFAIRGMKDSGVVGEGQTISYQVDGTYIPSSRALWGSSITSTWDLEQIEVLRGPQSTQQGQNAMAGAINVRTKDPIFEEEYKFRADYASFNEKKLATAINIPLNENWAFRLAGEYASSDGDIKHITTGEDVGDSESKYLRGKLRYATNDLNMILTITDNYREVPEKNIDINEYPQRRVVSKDYKLEVDSNTYNLNISYDFDDRWSLKSNSSYLDSEYTTKSDGFIRGVDDEVLSEELKVLYTEDKLRLVVGSYYSLHKEKGSSNLSGLEMSSYGQPGFYLYSAGKNNDKTTNYALFTELEYKLNEKWILIAGLRYDKEKQTHDSTSTLSVTPYDPIGSFSNTTREDKNSNYDALLPKLGLIYTIKEDVTTGFTIQKGYRAGGSAMNSYTLLEYEYDPEYTTNYEWSFRSLLLDKTLKFNTNIFYTKYEDMQISRKGPSGYSFDNYITNGGKSSIYGAEIETDYDINESLNLFFNLAYAKTQFDEYNENGVDYKGKEFINAPKWTGSIGGSYKFNRNIMMNLYGTYTSYSYSTLDNIEENKSDSAFITNTSITYKSDDNWSTKLYVRNLFDKEYITNKGLVSQVADPRVVGVSFNYQF